MVEPVQALHFLVKAKYPFLAFPLHLLQLLQLLLPHLALLLEDVQLEFVHLQLLHQLIDALIALPCLLKLAVVQLSRLVELASQGHDH